MLRSPLRQGVSRPVMSFEEAMKGALDKTMRRGDPTSLISKWGVEVFFRIPFEGESSYKQSFPAHTISPRKETAAGVPTLGEMVQARPSVPFIGTTTNQDMYKSHTFPAPEPAHARAPLPERPPKVPFSGESSYDAQFKAPKPESYASPSKQNPINESAGGASYSPARVPFEGSSTSSDHYKAPPADAYRNLAVPFSPSPSPDRNPRVKFQGTTTNSDTYVAHPNASPAPAAGHANQPDAGEFKSLPDDRTWETSNSSTYMPPTKGMTTGIDVEADREGRLKVYVERGACVEDLKRVLEELTMIPKKKQHLVRLLDGREMREGDRLVRELHWSSGEELTLTCVKEQEEQGEQGRQAATTAYGVSKQLTY